MRISISALIAAGALTLVSGAASAQGYQDTAYQPNENVEITVPHYGPQRSELGAPNVRVSLSRAVRYDDLDLRTRHGARVLRERIQLTARLLCRDLDERYPVTADDSPPCYKNAADDALYRADRAIADARGYED